jgi:arginyl-tRNA synthetase
MEEPDSKEQILEREMAEKGVMAQYETAFAYGIYHDVLIWESDIIRNQMLSRAMKLLAERHITKVPKEGKYKDCVVVETDSKDVREGEDSVKVFIRSNGVATYIAKDLAFHMWKLGMLTAEFKYKQFIMQPNGKPAYSSSKSGETFDFGGADIAINIIGSSQQYLQNVLKEVFKTISGQDNRIVHISYGEISMKGGTLSGREGGWLGEERNYTADDLLREMTKKTLEIVRNSEKIKEKANEKEIAQKIALSAIKFEFLRIDPEKKVVFDWDNALDLNTNSGPYCMYMYARASRILEKAELGSKGPKLNAADYKKIERNYDFELIKLIGSAQERVEKACREYRPNVIAEYLIELSLLFSKFYEHMPVLKGEESKAVRVAIVFATRQVIYNMLNLLGIQTVENM